MNVAIVVAIVALVSTVVGATIGAATTYVLAVRHEKADISSGDRILNYLKCRVDTRY